MPILDLVQTLAPEQEWHYPHCVPCNELVFLDGDAKVGKTLVTASLGGMQSNFEYTPGARHVLYANAREQNDLLQGQMPRQNPDFKNVGRIDLDELPREGSVLQTLPTLLLKYIKECKPQLIFLDGLQRFIESRIKEKDKPFTLIDYELFWRELREMAEVNKCTIYVTRQDGLHQSRSYGPYTRSGTLIARIIYTLEWHPVDPNKRILTLRHNQRGPAGIQLHMTICPNGFAFVEEPDPHYTMKPAKAPSPWRPDSVLADPYREAFSDVEEVLNKHPLSEEHLKMYVSKLHPQANFFKLMARMKLPTKQYKNALVYFPTPAMESRKRMKELDREEEERQNTPQNQPIPARTDPKPNPLVTDTRGLSITQKPVAKPPLSRVG